MDKQIPLLLSGGHAAQLHHSELQVHVQVYFRVHRVLSVHGMGVSWRSKASQDTVRGQGPRSASVITPDVGVQCEHWETLGNTGDTGPMYTVREEEGRGTASRWLFLRTGVTRCILRVTHLLISKREFKSLRRRQQHPLPRLATLKEFKHQSRVHNALFNVSRRRTIGQEVEGERPEVLDKWELYQQGINCMAVAMKTILPKDLILRRLDHVTTIAYSRFGVGEKDNSS
ncbi:hypothetical protein RRG08_047831 [Elysia crispata]|uniref:Uncharacterized protein n=1 Tax=Elysia crispata TaxID=231223 RepID=A0AAE1DNF1_9GAST|nr:hypothetical protein RRG08_047831 [Elysia crispata]